AGAGAAAGRCAARPRPPPRSNGPGEPPGLTTRRASPRAGAGRPVIGPLGGRSHARQAPHPSGSTSRKAIRPSTTSSTSIPGSQGSTRLRWPGPYPPSGGGAVYRLAQPASPHRQRPCTRSPRRGAAPPGRRRARAAPRGAAEGERPRRPRVLRRPSTELLGQADDDVLGAADVAEPVGLLVLRDLADEFGAAAPQAGDGVVD